MLKTAGSQTLTAADVLTSTSTGTSSTINLRSLVVASFTPTPSGFVATFSKPFDPTTINLYDDSGVYGPDDVTLTTPSGPPVSFHGSLIIDPTDTTITFVKTSTFTNSVNSFNPQTGVLAAGTYTVTFRSAANGFKDLSGVLLDGGGGPGTNFVTTFVVAATPTQVVGIPSFARRTRQQSSDQSAQQPCPGRAAQPEQRRQCDFRQLHASVQLGIAEHLRYHSQLDPDRCDADPELVLDSGQRGDSLQQPDRNYEVVHFGWAL